MTVDCTKLYHTTLHTPLGPLRIEANEVAITRVAFGDDEGDQEGIVEGIVEGIADQSHALVLQASEQLRQYFAGRRRRFELPLAPQGTTFRTRVWTALQTIPFGQTACYSDIANALNNPKAVRAVGAANGANPIAIIIPCHRVIGKDGSLTGYAGGLSRKQWLLDFE